MKRQGPIRGQKVMLDSIYKGAIVCRKQQNTPVNKTCETCFYGINLIGAKNLKIQPR